MSKAFELARELEKLHINNMYKQDFYWTWDKTDDEIAAVFAVADALRDLREHEKPAALQPRERPVRPPGLSPPPRSYRAGVQKRPDAPHETDAGVGGVETRSPLTGGR